VPLGVRDEARARRSWARFVVAAAGALSAVYLGTGDSTVWGEWIAVWPSFGWVVLLLPAAIRARSLLGLAALTGFLALTAEWPRFGRPDTGAADLRIVVWNVASEPRALAAVWPLEPDLVLVQEAMPPRELPASYSWHEAFDPAIASRLALTPVPSAPVGPWTPPQLALVTTKAGKRLLIANVRLVLPTPIVQVASFPHVAGAFVANTRQNQFPKLAALLRDAAGRHEVDAIVLAGDFNTPGRARSLAPLEPHLRDVWPEAGIGWGATAPAFLPLSRIDQCWVSARLKPLHARVLGLPHSDHKALLVDLALS
jgi:vancomycin resistance protein VanJ